MSIYANKVLSRFLWLCEIEVKQAQPISRWKSLTSPLELARSFLEVI